MPATYHNHFVGLFRQGFRLGLPLAGRLADGFLQAQTGETGQQVPCQAFPPGWGKGGLADHQRFLTALRQLVCLGFVLNDVAFTLAPADNADDLRMLRITQDDDRAAIAAGRMHQLLYMMHESAGTVNCFFSNFFSGFPHIGANAVGADHQQPAGGLLRRVDRHQALGLQGGNHSGIVDQFTQRIARNAKGSGLLCRLLRAGDRMVDPHAKSGVPGYFNRHGSIFPH